MTTATPHRRFASLLEVPDIVDVHAPRWFNRLPRWVSTGAVLVVLMAISAFVRTRTLSGELWFNEAGAVGLASHSLGSLLGAVHRAGAAPLYYLVLHVWVSLFGAGETATHSLSLLLGAAQRAGGDVDGMEHRGAPRRDLRGGPVRLQLVPDALRPGDPAL